MLGNSAGKTFNGDSVTNDKAVREWQMQEGDGGWRIDMIQKDGKIKVETIASYNMCTKCLKISIEELISKQIINSPCEIKGMTFMGKVCGTGPDFEDAYRCYIDLLD